MLGNIASLTSCLQEGSCAPHMTREQKSETKQESKDSDDDDEKPASGKPLECSHDGRGGGIRTHDLFVPKLLAHLREDPVMEQVLMEYGQVVREFQINTSQKLSEKIATLQENIEGLCSVHAPQI
jgi:hypothetical protein